MDMPGTPSPTRTPPQICLFVFIRKISPPHTSYPRPSNTLSRPRPMHLSWPSTSSGPV
ncbi:hypothetical protein C2E23DRAFT_824142 [Lenzites betulinus]|nr:hypothetical protein C2E23DRAFT_824142 [Lenzites betulinus]